MVSKRQHTAFDLVSRSIRQHLMHNAFLLHARVITGRSVLTQFR